MTGAPCSLPADDFSFCQCQSHVLSEWHSLPFCSRPQPFSHLQRKPGQSPVRAHRCHQPQQLPPYQLCFLSTEDEISLSFALALTVVILSKEPSKRGRLKLQYIVWTCRQACGQNSWPTFVSDLHHTPCRPLLPPGSPGKACHAKQPRIHFRVSGREEHLAENGG
jgi:hypothetical protein